MGDFGGIRRQIRHEARGARAIEREIDAEIEAHLALRADHLIARGMPPEIARAEALRRFGDMEQARRSLRASAKRREERLYMREWLDSVRKDLVFAARQIARAPGFSALGVLTFALGIGLTTAVFATVDAVLLRPLPFERPEQLVFLESVDSLGRPIQVVSADDWFDWNRENRSFSSIGLYQYTRLPVLGEGEARRAPSALANPELFETMRPRMLFGRAFTTADLASPVPVVVVSEGLWRRALGEQRGDTLTLRVGGRVHTVVGVLAAGQEFPSGTDLWIPYHHRQHGGGTRNNVNWQAVGRLRPATTLARATADLAAVSTRIRERDPVALYAYGVHLTPLRDEVVGSARQYLRLLMASVALVLLIACANLASAHLARGAARAREMVVRAALGASRGRIVRQLLVEHLLLAVIGGAVGTLLAIALTRGIVAFSADQLPRARDVAVDGRVLLFGFVVSTASGVLAGMLPALQAARMAARGILVHDARGAIRGGRGLPGRMLVGAEIALAVVLVSAAGLLIQSFRAVLARPLGFETRHVAMAELSLSGPAYAQDQARRFAYWDALLASLRSAPGIEAAGLANWVPLGIGGMSFVEIGGRQVPGADAGYRVVSDGYFDALRVPLVAGRLISANDDFAASGVAVINRAMAEKYWPGENPIGGLVRATSMEPRRDGAPPRWLSVVGVVGNVRHWGYEQDVVPEMYVSYRQLPGRTFALTVVARGRGPDGALLDLVRRRIRRLDSGIPADVELMAARAERETAQRRFAMSVLSVFGVLALALAAIGVYGSLAFAVAQRTREMAVRAALGADRGTLLRLVMGGGLRIIFAGVTGGLLAAAGLARLMRSMLFEVQPTDPMVFGVATATILAAATLAALVPAISATRIEPMQALKAE